MIVMSKAFVILKFNSIHVCLACKAVKLGVPTLSAIVSNIYLALAYQVLKKHFGLGMQKNVLLLAENHY